MRRSPHALLPAAALLALLLALPALASAQSACERKGGLPTADGGCTLTTAVTVTVDYPIALADGGVVESTVDAYIAEEKALMAGLVTGEPFVAPGPLTLNITHTHYVHSTTVFSLLFTSSAYTGGAHPNSTFRAFTFNIAEGRPLRFDDVFPPERDPLLVIVPLVRESLLAQLEGMMGGPLQDIDRDWVLAGTSMNAANYQDFVLTDAEVIFFFEPYQVAAYALGPQSVALPLSALAGVMAL